MVGRPDVAGALDGVPGVVRLATVLCSTPPGGARQPSAVPARPVGAHRLAVRRAGRRVVAGVQPTSCASSGRKRRAGSTRSTKPCASRNSAVWKPGGSSCRMVCSMTRGPANPSRAPGSATIDVAERGERAGDAAVGGVGEDAHREQAGLVERAERLARLGHLHQGEHALLHAGAAGRGHQQQRAPLLQRRRSAAGRPARPPPAEAAAEEAEVHGAQRRPGCRRSLPGTTTAPSRSPVRSLASRSRST